jgi:DNA-binding response OmpR family regulator
MKNEKKFVVIIEDDAMISSMYKTKLDASGFEVMISDNGADGLELVKKEKPDIILLDIILPQLDGFSVLEAIKADEKTKKIPVLILTNLGTEEDIDKGKKLGALDYIVKANLTPAEVIDKVNQYIDK